MKPGLPSMWRRTSERYNLIGSRCETCGTYYMPGRAICPMCRRKGKIVPHKYSGNGKIYSYTVIRVAPEGYEFYVPYVLAIVELEEGARITGQIVDVDPEEVKIGMPVEMVFRKLHEDNPEGLITYGFKFRPVVQI
ncbi:MAG: Zn-ribbon domain-containing OB-fold protein [Candidatus Micrarchaeia archaeon]